MSDAAMWAGVTFVVVFVVTIAVDALWLER